METVIGQIVELKQYNEFGNEFGTVECPVCHAEMEIKPMGKFDEPKCHCGLVWSIEVNAVGRKPDFGTD